MKDIISTLLVWRAGSSRDTTSVHSAELQYWILQTKAGRTRVWRAAEKTKRSFAGTEKQWLAQEEDTGDVETYYLSE